MINSKHTEQSTYSLGIEPYTIKGSNQFDTLFDNSKLHQFKIVMSQEEWDGLSSDMLDYEAVNNNMRTGNYRKADLYYSDENGDVKIDEVGVRSKGNTTRKLPETSTGLHRFNFKLKFNETFDMLEDTADYYERDHRNFAGLSTLNFKAHDGTDTSNIREVFCYDLLKDFVMVSSKASLATLIFVVDGVEHDYGVVRYIEPVDKDFLTKRFGGKKDDGNLYKCLWQSYGPATLMPITREESIGIKDWVKNYHPTYDLKTNQEEKNFQDLKDFINNINTLNDDELKAYLEDNFEVDHFIRYEALNIVLGGLDDYWCMGNNYYMYFNEDGKIEWIPFDYDNTLAAGWSGEPNWSYEGIAKADIYKWKNLNAAMFDAHTTHPLINKILEIDEYKKKYEEYLKILTDAENNYFTYSRFLDLYNELFDLYGGSVENEMHEGDEWKLRNEKWFFETKIASVKEQLSKEKQ